MPYTEGLRRIERPKLAWRAASASDVSAFMLRALGGFVGMVTPDELSGEPVNYGRDISTLALRLEAGSF
jgi:hypothetical protein